MLWTIGHLDSSDLMFFIICKCHIFSNSVWLRHAWCHHNEDISRRFRLVSGSRSSWPDWRFEAHWSSLHSRNRTSWWHSLIAVVCAWAWEVDTRLRLQSFSTRLELNSTSHHNRRIVIRRWHECDDFRSFQHQVSISTALHDIRKTINYLQAKAIHLLASLRSIADSTQRSIHKGNWSGCVPSIQTTLRPSAGKRIWASICSRDRPDLTTAICNATQAFALWPWCSLIIDDRISQPRPDVNGIPINWSRYSYDLATMREAESLGWHGWQYAKTAWQASKVEGDFSFPRPRQWAYHTTVDHAGLHLSTSTVRYPRLHHPPILV